MNDLKSNYQYYYDYDDRRTYLYYDKGNPSEDFFDIEIGEDSPIFGVHNAKDQIYENLCLKYGGVHGIWLKDSVNTTLRGLEFGWIGGSHQLNYPVANTRYGNAFEAWDNCEDNLVEKCYVYQIYDAALTFQGFNVDTYKNISYIDNVLDYNVYAIEYWADNCVMTDILFQGNFFRFTGYGWGTQRPDFGVICAVNSWEYDNKTSNFLLKDNYFDTSILKLFKYVSNAGAQHLPKLEGNTYAQTTNSAYGGQFQRDPVHFTRNFEKNMKARGEINPVVIHNKNFG